MNNYISEADKQRGYFYTEGAMIPEIEGYEILFLAAGSSPFWELPADVLRAAVPLFDGLLCHVDFLPSDTENSALQREAVGTISDPVYDEDSQGIRAHLWPFEPCASFLQDICRQNLERDGSGFRVGFSTDLGFEADGRTVTGILQVFSVAIAANPDCKGMELRTLNKIRSSKIDDFVRGRMEAVKSAYGDAGVYMLRSLRSELCRDLLAMSLSDCGLPDLIKESIRRDFSNHLYKPEELREAIQSAREMIDELNEYRGFDPLQPKPES